MNKNIERIMEETGLDTLIAINKLSIAEQGTIIEGMRRYARLVVDDMMTRPDLIYCEGIAMEEGEPCYNYEAITKYKEQL